MGVFVQSVYVEVTKMEAMDVAVARKLKELVLSPLIIMEREQGVFETLLDVLEAGHFTDPSAVVGMLQQAANTIGTREHLQVFGQRLALLVERAQREPRRQVFPRKPEGP